MMKRKLIMQMRNEWRSNIWMMVELFIVGLVLWLVFTILNGLSALHQEPVGADYNDIYVGDLGFIDKESDTYKPYDEGHDYRTDLDMIIANLKANPYVEIAGVGSNTLPYNYNYSGNYFFTTIDGKTESYSGNRRYMSPEVVKAIRLRGLNGETPDELAAIIERGDIILGEKEMGDDEERAPLQRWRGKEAFQGNDSSTVYTVGAIINPIRRSDYEPSRGVVIINGSDSWSQMVVRVKEGRGDEFMASLTGDALEFGNVYVSNMQSIEDIRENSHRDINVLIRNIYVCAIFVLVTVFLGFLGSFWYRTQQRVPELALRKTNGATDADLFRRFISEGLLLLVIPAILMVPSGMALIGLFNRLNGDEGGSFFELNFQGLPISQWIVWAALAMSIVSLAVMIVAGIWMPARRAMKVEPAIALKDQ